MDMDTTDELSLTTLGDLSDMVVDRFFKNEKLLKFLTENDKKSVEGGGKTEPKQETPEEYRNVLNERNK